MNAPFSQTERLGRLTTELGPDVLSLLRFDGSDHLNDLFEYRVEALATREDRDFDALVGTHATVEIGTHDGSRLFSGSAVGLLDGNGVPMLLLPRLEAEGYAYDVRELAEDRVHVFITRKGTA